MWRHLSAEQKTRRKEWIQGETREGSASVIYTVIMLAFWAVALPFAALVCFPWTFLTGNISFLYRTGMWAAWTGVRLAGVKVETVGLERIDPSRTYIFMSNHVSNIDPPILLPLIPRRTSVMAKKELFSYPLLGKTMRLGSLVPVDRGNREAGIAAVREAEKVIRSGINMTIYVEGKAVVRREAAAIQERPVLSGAECGVPVVPVTMEELMKSCPRRDSESGRERRRLFFMIRSNLKILGRRDELMDKVRAVIDSGLPQEMQTVRAQGVVTVRGRQDPTAKFAKEKPRGREGSEIHSFLTLFRACALPSQAPATC